MTKWLVWEMVRNKKSILSCIYKFLYVNTIYIIVLYELLIYKVAKIL